MDFLNDESCMVRSTLIDMNNELKYYPFMITLNKCTGSCNVLSPNICVPKGTKNINVKALNMITNKYEVMFGDMVFNLEVPQHLSDSEFQALKNLSHLKKEVIIQKSDKGNSVVLISKSDYIRYIEGILKDVRKLKKYL